MRWLTWNDRLRFHGREDEGLQREQLLRHAGCKLAPLWRVDIGMDEAKSVGQ